MENYSYSLSRLLFLYSQKYPNIDEQTLLRCLKQVNKLYPSIEILVLSQTLLLQHETEIKSGTSGYMFDWWYSKSNFNNFYPLSINKTKLLPYYATNFNSVEINSTFYKLPSSSTLQKWYEMTPPNFSFIVKMSKFATHNKKLIDFTENLRTFYFGKVELLKEKCIGILIQMPPLFKNTNTKSKIDNLTPLERIKKIGREILLLKLDIPQIFIEFRDLSWFNDKVVKLLREIKWSLVFVVTKSENIMKGGTTDIYPDISKSNITVDGIAYVRFHGTSVITPYIGLYSISYLNLIKDRLNVLNIKKQYYMFNNTDSLTKNNNNNTYYPDAIIDAMVMSS